ncbi:MAG TPA: molybdopterin converting factor subunit 1 [Methylomirabilota bacterium]|jgi:molybdopterin converting factor subunit 1|nr:molybdopterin converting factor subunit 1 [Methylomirabilota bacterium]
MRIKLRYFAALRERLRRSEEMFEVPADATVATVWEMLKKQHPELGVMERSIAFAVGQEYVDKTHPLQDNDELAFIPPVSGGGADSFCTPGAFITRLGGGQQDAGRR